MEKELVDQYDCSLLVFKLIMVSMIITGFNLNQLRLVTVIWNENDKSYKQLSKYKEGLIGSARATFLYFPLD